MTGCGFDAWLIGAYLDNECSPEERVRIETHLHTCEQCQDFLSQSGWNKDILLCNRPEVLGRPAPKPSAGFADRVMKGVKETPR